VKLNTAGLGDRIELLEHLPRNRWMPRSLIRQAQGGGIDV
jgi:hypothetical protein